MPDSDIIIISGATAPVNGGSGTGHGVAEKGSHYVAQDTGLLYINTGTKATPTWTILEAGGASVIASVLTGFAAAAGTVSATDSILQAFQKIVGNMTALQTAAEVIAAAGALSISNPESIVNNATGGSYAVTLAAPSNQDGQIKVIKLRNCRTHRNTRNDQHCSCRFLSADYRRVGLNNIDLHCNRRLRNPDGSWSKMAIDRRQRSSFLKNHNIVKAA